MRASAEPVDGNRVRLSIEVDEEEFAEALEATARRLSSQIRVPGFRPGKVPRPVLEARLGGSTALRQQAITDVIPDLYAQAVIDTEVDPISSPEIDVTSGADDGPVSFDAVVEVRPTVAIPGYQGLVVTVPSLTIPEEDVDRQIDRLRAATGELQPTEHPAAGEDFVTIDLHGTGPGGEDIDRVDFLYQVGSGSFGLPDLDDRLLGARPGDILQFEAAVPTGADPDATVTVPFRVLVKDVKRQVLPDVTDEWASEASEFDTVDELRSDLRGRLGQARRVEAQLTWRQGALDALVGLVESDPPEALVDSELRERLHDLSHRLEARRLTLAQFIEASGSDQQTLLAQLRAEAARAVQLDLALRALADAEELDVTDEELTEAIAELAERAGAEPDALRASLDRAGRIPAVRSERRRAKAVAWLLDHVELVDEEGKPVAREDLRPEPEPTITPEAEPGHDDLGGGDGAAASAEQGSDDVVASQPTVGGARS